MGAGMGHRRNAAPMRYPCGTFHPALIEDGLTGLEIMLPGVVPTRVYLVPGEIFLGR